MDSSTKTVKRRRELVCDGAFDIETEGWSRFVVGAVKAHGELFMSWNENELLEHLLALAFADSPTILFAHNGGKFDDLWFLARIVEMGFAESEIEVALAGQRLVMVRLGNLILRDSAALIPFRLEKAAGLGSVAKVETDLPCTCKKKRWPSWAPQWAKRGCGGYCSIRRDMPRAHRKRLEWYLENDVECVPSMLEGLETFASRHDIDLCATIGASSWRTVNRRLGIPKANWKIGRLSASKVYNFARLAYFGGRCQVGRPFASEVYRYDITSAYPFALSTVELPTGDMSHEDKGSNAYSRGKEGVFLARVNVPNHLHLPPLPARTKNRVVYPTGSVSGVWAGNELRYAELLGVRIERISQSLVWSESEVVFSEFLKEMGSLRSHYKRDEKDAEEKQDKLRKRTSGAIAEWLKWFPNSLTGKLAQNPETEQIVINPNPERLACPADGQCWGFGCSKLVGCCPHVCYGTCKGRGLLPMGDLKMRIFVRDEYRLNDNSHVHWAAYLTAATREKWHRQATDDGVGGKTFCLGDTDSIIATTPRTTDVDLLGRSEIGTWKFEGRAYECRTLAPKTYHYIDAETGEVIARSKGIPDAAHNFEILASGDEVVADRGVKSFKAAASGGASLFERKRISRRMSQGTCNVCQKRHYGDRILEADGITYPQDADGYHDPEKKKTK